MNSQVRVSDLGDLAQSVRRGNRLALARLLTLIENGDSAGEAALGQLYPLTGKAHVVGVTGAPGTGKSSLVNELAKAFRAGSVEGPSAERSETPPAVGIVAVDPSSPFSGGAILGDRIRMRDLSGDPGVFVRSMASRGSLGGLARATASVIDVLDAAGFDLILVETVGAGQAEVDITRHAHTTLVVEAPGLGDDIQAIKAGVLEVADILVVNKSDLPGAEEVAGVLRATLELAIGRGAGAARGSGVPPWDPPVLLTVATSGRGVGELAAAIRRHREYLKGSGQLRLRQRERIAATLEALLRERLAARWHSAHSDAAFEGAVARVASRELSPGAAVATLLRETD